MPLLRDVVLHNDGAEPLVGATLAIVLLPNLCDELRLPLEELWPGDRIEVRAPDVRFEPGRLRAVLEREAVNLRVRVYSGELCVAEENRAIDLLAFNEWPGLKAPLALLASFVTPNQTALLPVVEATKARLRATGSDSIDGYQSRSKQRVLTLVRAAFEAVQALGVSYLPVPASFEQTGQKIRLLDTVLTDRGATCLDATLLFASLLEAMGLRPLIILLHGHARDVAHRRSLSRGRCGRRSPPSHSLGTWECYCVRSNDSARQRQPRSAIRTRRCCGATSAGGRSAVRRRARHRCSSRRRDSPTLVPRTFGSLRYNSRRIRCPGSRRGGSLSRASRIRAPSSSASQSK